MIADDPITPGGIVAHQVLETFVRETDALYDLYVDGEVISTTGEHPFWVPNIGWVEAKDLTVGSLLQTADGRVVDVDGVEKREGKFEVYNFKVEGIPTYFVSDLGILVHNTCEGTPEWREFPNLRPRDVINYEVQARQITFDGNKWTYTNSRGQKRTPNGLYNFVTMDGKNYIARQQYNGAGGHIDISKGRNVDFAGQIRFGQNQANRGKIQTWDNASGHYQPGSSYANQAGLPLDSYRPYRN